MNEPEPQIQRKQFIAGAVCPQCDALDRIVVEYTEALPGQPQLSRRRCVACGFADAFGEPSNDAGTGAIPRGKPERPRRPEVAPSVVTIVDPKA